MVPTNYYVILSAILFGLGVFAFIFKRNVITIFMSIELMLNAVNLAFVAFSQALGKLDGQVFVLFVIVVAAAEAAVGLGIIILIARNRQTLNVERVDLLKLYAEIPDARIPVDCSAAAAAGLGGEWTFWREMAEKDCQLGGAWLNGAFVSRRAGS